MFRSFAVAMVLSVLCGVCSAAIIYEPVQYQYRDPMTGRPTFYYGGDNPRTFAAGMRYQRLYNADLNSVADPALHGFVVGTFADNLMHHGLNGEAPVVYSDLLPPGMNGFPLGLTIEDARNEAYANVPRYFRKRDLLMTAVRGPSGQVIVPPSIPMHGEIDIHPYHAPTTQPSGPSAPQPILILPKSLLNPPAAAAQPTASAR